MTHTKTISLILILFLPFTLFGCSQEANKDTLKTKSPKSLKTEYEEQTPVDLHFDEYSIIFGFSDETGKNILAISDTLPEPGIYKKTIVDNGDLIPLKFVEQKTGVEDKDYQLTYYNFSNCGGYLFECSDGIVNYKKSVVMLSDKFLSNRKYIKNVSKEKNPLGADVLEQIKILKHKEIKNSFPLVKIDNNRSLYIVNFEIVNDTAMFSFVLVSPNKLVTKDNIAEFDPYGTWRVDDGGVVNPEMFDILAVFESKFGIEIAINWIGAEGDYIEYLIENGNQLEMGKNEYRYTLPN